MSDLEFQRELSPEQIREALSLLDSKTGAQNQNLDLSPPEEVDPEVDQSSTTTATQERPPAAEDSKQRKKHLNLAVAFYGLGIAAAGALALLSWSEGTLTPAIAHQDQLAKSAHPALPIANALPDQNPGGSERRPSTPEVAGSSPIDHANRDSEQAAEDAANSASAIPYAAIPAIATRQARWDEQASREPRQASRHARGVRVAAAKKRFWQRHWQARAEINGGEWCFFACPPWRAQRVFYEPPRNTTQ
jgi:hypothetical protein